MEKVYREHRDGQLFGNIVVFIVFSGLEFDKANFRNKLSLLNMHISGEKISPHKVVVVQG